MTARILIVDDTPLNLKLLEAKLARDYYIVVTAQNGVEALAKVAEEKPDIVLLDVMMPEMDGFETCRRLKADPETAYIPVVMITALTDVADRVRGLECGADDFLAKPINDLALMSRIRSLLRLKVLMDEWRLREATAQQLTIPGESFVKFDPFDVQDSRILIVNDDAAESEAMKTALSVLAAHISIVTNVADAETAVVEGAYDLVFSSLELHNEDGMMICPKLRTHQQSKHIPILLMAGADNIALIAKGLDLGANDYLLRPFDEQELFARTRTQLRHKRNYDRLRDGFEKNIKLALTDALTGAFNRRYLDAHLPNFLRQAEEKRKPLAVQMLDIDHFKKVNDTHGHAAGDAVLREVAKRVQNNVRPSDFFVRMGGEEFAVVMPETDLEQARKVAERLRQCIAEAPIPLPAGGDLSVTMSIGLSVALPGNGDSKRIFDRADAALYRAKEGGRNRVEADLSAPQTA